MFCLVLAGFFEPELLEVVLPELPEFELLVLVPLEEEVPLELLVSFALTFIFTLPLPVIYCSFGVTTSSGVTIIVALPAETAFAVILVPSLSTQFVLSTVTTPVLEDVTDFITPSPPDYLNSNFLTFKISFLTFT